MKNFLIEILFPKFCLICKKEGSFLCKDCFSLIEIHSFAFCPVCQKRVLDFRTCKECKRKTNLSGLLFSTYYEKNKILKKLIDYFKYPPFVKDISKELSKIIISYLSLIEFNFPKNSLFVPVPLSRKRKKWRGFNQAEEITKELSKFYNIPLRNDLILKIKETLPQVELSSKERKENIKGAFKLNENFSNEIKNKTIFIVDDISTTGATLEEIALEIKKGKPKEIFGLVVARG